MQFNNASQQLASILDNSNGRFFSVQFVKKDGSIRQLIGRTEVKKYLKGGKKTTDDSKFVTVYDVQNHGYRCIDRNSILAVRFDGVEAVVAK